MYLCFLCDIRGINVSCNLKDVCKKKKKSMICVFPVCGITFTKLVVAGTRICVHSNSVKKQPFELGYSNIKCANK